MPASDRWMKWRNQLRVMLVYHAAIFIQTEIQSLENNIPFSPIPTDLVETTIKKVPDSLFNFLAWVLPGDCDQSEAVSVDRVNAMCARDCRCILSLAQDLIHCTIHGRVNTPRR